MTLLVLYGIVLVIVGIIFSDNCDVAKKNLEEKSNSISVDLPLALNNAANAAILVGLDFIITAIVSRWVLVSLAIGGVFLNCVMVHDLCMVAGWLPTIKYAKQDPNVERYTFLNYREDSGDENSRKISRRFRTLGCCGINNYTEDFFLDNGRSGFIPSENRKKAGFPDVDSTAIPITCCKNFNYKNAATQQTFLDHKICLDEKLPNVTYLQGCDAKTAIFMADNKVAIISFAVVTLVLDLIIIALFYLH